MSMPAFLYAIFSTDKLVTTIMIIGLGRPKTRNPEILFYLNKRAWKFELEGLVQEPFP